MRCSELKANPSAAVVYTCGRCAIFYYDHQTLLEHLYWKHGTESDVCHTCNLRKWSFAIHKCYHLPNMDCYVGGGVGKAETKAVTVKCPNTENNLCDIGEHVFALSEVIVLDPNTAPVDDIENSDIESSTSGDSGCCTGREVKYCYCGKDIEGAQMIGCDSETCVLEWYHFKCVNIDEAPEGTWYCPECAAQS